MERTKACLSEIGRFCKTAWSGRHGTISIPISMAEYTDDILGALADVRKHSYSPPIEETEVFTRVYDLGKYRRVPPYGPPAKPTRFFTMGYSNRLITEAFKKSLAAVREMEREDPDPTTYPVYTRLKIEEDRLSEDTVGYYVFWKKKADAGLYYDADDYYAQIYFLEALIDGISVAELRKLCGTPVFHMTGIYAGELIAEYFMIHDEPLPISLRPQIYRQYQLRHLIEKGPGCLDKDSITDVLIELGWSRRSYYSKPPKNYFILLLNLFLRIHSEYSSDMRGLTCVPLKLETLSKVLDTDVPKSVRICVASSDFRNTFSAMAEDVLFFYNRYVQEGYLRKKPVNYFGVNIVPHMNRILDRIFHPPQPVDVKIDAERVRAAQDDLDYVVGIVAADTEPAETPEPEEKPPELAADDSWISFGKALSEECLGYLRKCLSGTSAVNRLEDEINGIALDAVGDTVVEGGRIVEDYREELSRILG